MISYVHPFLMVMDVLLELCLLVHVKTRILVDRIPLHLKSYCQIKKAYEKAFLYTEADDMDIGYFVSYNLRVLEQSFKQLQDYIKRKQNEKKQHIYICAWVISMNVKHKLLNYMRMILKH